MRESTAGDHSPARLDKIPDDDRVLDRRVWFGGAHAHARLWAAGGPQRQPARNLRDWTGPVDDRDVQRGGVAAPVPFVGDHGGQAHASAWACEAPEDHRQVAGVDDTRTTPRTGAGNPE